MKDLDATADHNVVSKRRWAKDLHPGSGDWPPSLDGRLADKDKYTPKVAGRRKKSRAGISQDVGNSDA
jgi:hypothetical protein